MQTDIIKPCPHCGGSASLNASYSYKTRGYFVYVKCDICGAQAKIFTSQEDPAETGWTNAGCNNAVAAWNMRTEVNETNDRKYDPYE